MVRRIDGFVELLLDIKDVVVNSYCITWLTT